MGCFFLGNGELDFQLVLKAMSLGFFVRFKIYTNERKVHRQNCLRLIVPRTKGTLTDQTSNTVAISTVKKSLTINSIPAICSSLVSMGLIQGPFLRDEMAGLRAQYSLAFLRYRYHRSASGHTYR